MNISSMAVSHTTMDGRRREDSTAKGNSARDSIKNRDSVRNRFPVAIGSIISLFLLFLTTLTTSPTSPLVLSLSFYCLSSSSTSKLSSIFVESKLHPLPSFPPLPRFAYLISGSSGDGNSLKRTLLALYHPLNQYVVHLDLESSVQERDDLEAFVKGHVAYNEFKKGYRIHCYSKYMGCISKIEDTDRA